ncbi:MAG: MotA/TolQ/ExbB proton channel family protein [bacterium]
MESLINFFRNGGVFMVPLLFCSIISLAFILERGFFLRRRNILDEELKATVDALPIGGSVNTIANLVGPGQTTLARLVRTALTHLPWSKAENVEAVQTVARSEAVQMEHNLVILEIITGISPLLGLLGTVSGLIVIFTHIGDTTALNEGMVIARGIAEALNTTVAGLVIAIPSLIAHSFYSRKIEAMMAEMESICMDLLAKMYLQAEDFSPEPSKNA